MLGYLGIVAQVLVLRLASADVTLAFRSPPSGSRFKIILVVKRSSLRSAERAGIPGSALMGNAEVWTCVDTPNEQP